MVEQYEILDNETPFTKLRLLGKIKRLFKSYESGKLEAVDRNLIRGIFVRKIKDFKLDYEKEFKKLQLQERLKVEF